MKLLLPLICLLLTASAQAAGILGFPSTAGSNSLWTMAQDDLLGTAGTRKISITNLASYVAANIGGIGGPRIIAGSGSPEGSVAAPVGSVFMRTNDPALLYSKRRTTGPTGWHEVGSGAPAEINASVFNFGTAQANNYTNMLSMSAYATSNGCMNVKFDSGTYNVNLPISGDPIFRGYSVGAFEVTNLYDITINATSAQFHNTNGVDWTEAALFWFSGCTNTTINAKLSGAHTSTDANGVKGVWFRNDNVGITCNLVTSNLWDGVRIGQYIYQSSTDDFYGNRDIKIVSTNTDTYYGVVVMMVANAEIDAYCSGTAEGTFGLHRSVYIAGSTNVVASSRSINANVQDGVNIICITPVINPPYNQGCTNLTLYAEDLGSTNNVLYQSLVKINVVSSDRQATNGTHNGIHVNVKAFSSATVRTNPYSTVCFGSMGTAGTTSHTFTNIVISGSVGRVTSYTRPAIVAESSLVGIGNLYLDLSDFHDAYHASAYTVSFEEDVMGVRVRAVNSDLNANNYFETPGSQTLTNYGYAPWLTH